MANNANRVTQNIWIGDIRAAASHEWLSKTGVTHVVNCTNHISCPFNKRGIHYLKLNLQDSPVPHVDDLFRVLEPSYVYICKVLAYSPKTQILVHCHAGISRSASVVIYYLMRSQNWTYETALDYLKGKRSIVKPNPWYEQQLKDVYKLLHPETGTISVRELQARPDTEPMRLRSGTALTSPVPTAQRTEQTPA